MILQALVRYYQRLIEQEADDIAPYGYSPEKISYEILLKPDGTVAQVNDIRDTSGKKPQPKLLQVPQPEKRTVGIKPNILWDKTSYVLGVSHSSKRADKEHEAFRQLHESVLADEDDPGLQALLAFLRSWSPDQFEAHGFPAEMIDTNVVFRLTNEHLHLHARPAAQALRARLLNSDEGTPTATATCLVNGAAASSARLHPPIKGVWGAQTSGAAIVSFNLDAFTSYGKSQGDNAPVSEDAAFAYTTALNYLLRRGEHNRQRMQIGDTSVVFWAEAGNAEQAAEAENLFSSFLNRRPDDASEAEKVRLVLDHVAQGRPINEVDPKLAPDTRMYVLGLAPNASRLSVRYWQADTLQGFARRIAEHAADLRLEPSPWRYEPSAYQLVLATVPHREGAKPKADDALNNVIGEMTRAILSGTLYPRSLLANTIMRLRTDADVSGLRVALCKAILAREYRLKIRTSKEEIPVSLDKQSTQPAYLLGRLFAAQEYAQRCALGKHINATIRDRYYGAASATPASIFPVLLRNTQNHMSKLRKENRGLAVKLENDLQEIIGKLPDHFPRALKMEDQGRFAIGYYHQTQTYFSRREDGAETEPATDESTDN